MKRFARTVLALVCLLLLGRQVMLEHSPASAHANLPYTPMADPPQPSPLLVGEGRDHAAVVLADLWDMNNVQDIYNEKTFGINSDYVFINTNRMNLDPISRVMYGTTANNDPHFFLTWPGYPEYQNFYKYYGMFNPINADLYRYLMFRMYFNQVNPDDRGQVIWAKTLDYTAEMGQSNFFTLRQGWHTYLLDMKTIGTIAPYTLPWAGNLSTLRIDPINRAGVDIKLDWVRLWADDGNQIPFTTITWTDSAGILSLYAVETSGSQDTSMPIATGLRASTLSRRWNAGIYPPDEYYIYSVQTKDYAVAAFNEPWDMRSTNQIALLNQFTATALGQEIRFTSSAGANDPSIYFRIDTNETKIDTSLYKYFSFRAKVDNPSAITTNHDMAMVFWFPAAGGAFNSNFIPLVKDSQYHVYTVDLSAIANWNSAQNIVLFRLDPFVTAKAGQQVNFVLDWASLSSEPPTEEADLNPILGWSNQPVTVQTAPQAEFLNPSFESGGDYATEVLGDPWDMNQPTDVITSFHLIDLDFTKGYAQFTTDGAVVDLTPSGDGQLMLRTGSFFFDERTPIDPQRYRFVSHDFRELDPQDTVLGSIHRYIVWADTPENNTTFHPEVTNENWNRYTLDLTKATIVQNVGGALPWLELPQVPYFLFHPNEIPTYTVTGGYDNVLLTSIPWADQSFTIRWRHKAGDPQTQVKLYRDTNRSLGGEVLIGETTLGAGLFNWNTSGVANGEYYIVMKMNDGLSLERIVYSLTPVAVKRRATITLNPLPGTLNAGLDYATQNQNPWDFNDASDLGTNLVPSGYSGLSGVSLQDGLFNFTSTNDDPYLFLAAPELINAASYRWLTFRLRSDYWSGWDARNDLVLTWWVNGNWYQSGVIKVYPGWNLYRVDMQQYPNWSGQVKYLRIDPTTAPGRSFALDWVRLTEPQTHNLTWSAANTNAKTRVSLYAVPADSGCTGVTAPYCPAGALTIAKNLTGVNSFNWDYGGLDGGQYQLIAVIDDRTSPVYEHAVALNISASGEPFPRLPETIEITAGANQRNFPVWFNIYNDGGGTYTWEASSLNPGLLTVRPPDSGETVRSSTIKFTVNSFNRNPGTYTGRILVTVTIDGVPQEFEIAVRVNIVAFMYLNSLPVTIR